MQQAVAVFQRRPVHRLLTRECRLSATGDYTDMGEAIAEKDGATPEAIMRRMVMRSRESAVAALAEMRGQSFDARRLLSA